MKVVFCIDDNLRYLPLLKVAVRSLREIEGPHAECLCVYAGANSNVLDTLARENIPVARHRAALNKNTLPQAVWFSIGCFLKLELANVAELANDRAVLYCDVDVMFRQPLSPLFNAPLPPYMGMAREHTAPFYHKFQSLDYMFQGRRYTVPMPFPIWTFSSGVVLFNLEKLRQRHLVDHFLAFAAENAEKIENLDQSLLNYYFGKKITRLPDCWNSPPYLVESMQDGRIIHFHGAKPWQTRNAALGELRINNFEPLREIWFSYLDQSERKMVESW